ncbi:MAG TPA: hypothetical protein VGL72_28020 [Bryobacteraceae bacterium]|jgi:hypothetical protein
MSRWTVRFRQALYPPEFQITPGDDEASLAVMVAHLATMMETLAPLAPTDTPKPPPVVTPTAGPDKAFVIDLCNQVHRLSRAVKKAQEQGGAEADKLQRHLDRLGEILAGYKVEWEDLTGQAYDPGRADFDPLGEPVMVPGLQRKTIIQCERPAVRFGGVLIQPAKGTVGRPPD